MRVGKVPYNLLQRLVFSRLGAVNDDVVGPGIGLDAAVIKLGDRSVVVAADPITGSVRDIGMLAVHVNANDVAMMGGIPRWFLSVILLPPDTSPDVLDQITQQIDATARGIGIAVVGGHTEVSPQISSPIVVGMAMGEATWTKERRSGPRDDIVLTKEAGIEGTAILATEREEVVVRGLGEDVVERAKRLRKKISVVPDAAIASRYATAMHDPTEGGIAGGLHEMAFASGVGFRVWKDRIPLLEETKRICALFRVDPLRLMGSGALLFTVDPQHTDQVMHDLEGGGIRATVIGRCTRTPEKEIRIKGRYRRLPWPRRDDLWVALERSIEP